MELTVADVEELSKAIRIEIADLYNEKVKIFDSPPDANMKYAQDLLKIHIADRLAKAGYCKLSPEKVVGMVSISEKEIAKLLQQQELILNDDDYESRDIMPDEADRIAKVICSNKSKILGVKGKHEKNNI